MSVAPQRQSSPSVLPRWHASRGRGAERPCVHRRHVMKWSLAATAAATGLCLAWWWPAAWAPVLLALILLTTFAAMVVLDRRAHGWARRRLGSEVQVRWAPAFLRERIAVVGAAILLFAMAAMATVLAAWLLDDRDVAMGAYAGFLLMAYLGLPFWILGLAEEVTAAAESDDDSHPHPPG